MTRIWGLAIMSKLPMALAITHFECIKSSQTLRSGGDFLLILHLKIRKLFNISPITWIESNNAPTSPISFLTILHIIVIQCSTPDTSQFLAMVGSNLIRVAPKSKSPKCTKNVFFDNRGFPDESEDYDICLYNINGGIVLRQNKYATPKLDTIDSLFNNKLDINEQNRRHDQAECLTAPY